MEGDELERNLKAREGIPGIIQGASRFLCIGCNALKVERPV